MGMSTRVVGYTADEQWQKMRAVWAACAAAGIDPPEAIFEFFRGEGPVDAPGREVAIRADKLPGEYEDGYEVDIEALPKGVRFIRFYCSW